VQLPAVTLDGFEAAADAHAKRLLKSGRYSEAALEFECAARADRALAEMTLAYRKHYVLSRPDAARAEACACSWACAAQTHSDLAARARGQITAGT
jgi:hypothetical protein